jgi:hypothetical protein
MSAIESLTAFAIESWRALARAAASSCAPAMGATRTSAAAQSANIRIDEYVK